jgi:hypothetical protein
MREEMTVESAVAMIIFNRPEHTRQVFARVAQARPQRLFVIADGPRSDHPQDQAKCEQARSVVERVDWKCEVLRNYADENLGCGVRPASGIDWVFEHTDRCIILEDDCVPDISFFRYCEELLERYLDDERVMTISGRNNLPSSESPYSYHFTWFPNCWGWATWRRAWRLYDFNIPVWKELRARHWLSALLRDERAVRYWSGLFDRAAGAGSQLDYWDHQWTFTCWSQHGLSIAPNVNLVQNVGFGEDATHTRRDTDYRARIDARAMAFPLAHPPYVLRDDEADAQRIQRLFPRKKPPAGIMRRLQHLFGAK